MIHVPDDIMLVALPFGYHLEEDEDFVVLMFDDEKIATFSSRFVDIFIISCVARLDHHNRNFRRGL